MTNVLAFRTKPGGVSVPAGTSQELGVVDVTPYERIRVVADERVGSGTGVTFLDLLVLGPHQQLTRVYEVPGTKLSVFVDAAGGSGTDALDVLIYGWKE